MSTLLLGGKHRHHAGRYIRQLHPRDGDRRGIGDCRYVPDQLLGPSSGGLRKRHRSFGNEVSLAGEGDLGGCSHGRALVAKTDGSALSIGGSHAEGAIGVGCAGEDLAP